MTRKNRKHPKNKMGKKRVAKTKRGEPGRGSSSLPPEPLALRPPHPIRALLDVATQAWESSLIDKLTGGGLKGRETLPDLNELGHLLQRQDLQNLAIFDKKIRTFLHPPPPPPPQIELQIQGIEPVAPSTWAPDQDVRVGFVVRNNSGQPTSGIVHGSATQDVVRTLVSSRWFQPGSRVNNLPSGQAFIGVLELKIWTAYHRLSGLVDIYLTYWVEDPAGTITFVLGLPGNQSAVTYNAVSFAQGSFGTLTGFAADIRPLFRDKDIQAMRSVDFPIDLASYQEVKNHAKEIYDSVAHPTGVISMPCDGLWPKDWVDTFKFWMDSGMSP